MDLQDSFMKNADGTDIFCKYWKPRLELGRKPGWVREFMQPRALVFISHGYAEHCSMYDHLARVLNDKEFFAFAHDHVGHGRSKGDRAYVSSYNVYVRDVLQHVDKVKKVFPGIPVFIVGHSMGGGIALWCGLERPGLFKGMALISAAIEFNPDMVTPFKRFFGKIVGRLFKNLVVASIDTQLLSRDKEVVKRFDEDPLVWHGGVKAGAALSGLQAMQDLETRFDDITWALLIQHGTADGLADINGSRKLNEKCASNDKTLSLYKDAYHQVHNEPMGMGERCINEIADWIDRRC